MIESVVVNFLFWLMQEIDLKKKKKKKHLLFMLIPCTHSSISDDINLLLSFLQWKWIMDIAELEESLFAASDAKV